MKFKKNFAAIAACLALVIPASAHASAPPSFTEVASCADFGTRTIRRSDNRIRVPLGQGDTMVWSDPTNNGRMDIDRNPGGSITGSRVRDAYSWTVGIPARPAVTWRIGVTRSGPGATQATVTCYPGSSQAGAVFSGTTQLQAMSKGVSKNAGVRLGDGTQNSYDPTNLFVTSGNATGGGTQWSAWISGEYHKLDGNTTDGHSTEFVIGVDTQISSNAILGLTIGIENLSFNGTEVRSIAFGPYYARRLANGALFDAMVTYAEPEYTGGTTATGDRISYAVNYANGVSSIAMGDWHPYVNLSGYSEDQSLGASIDQTRLIAGGRFDSSSDGSLTPFARVAIDYKNNRNSVTGTEEYLHPLLGLGIRGQMGNGALHAELGYAKYSSDVADYSAEFRYEVDF